MSKEITLFCLFSDERPNSAFKVTIDKSKTVIDLRDAIHKAHEKDLLARGIGNRHISLYLLAVDRGTTVAQIREALVEENALWGLSLLAEAFDTPIAHHKLVIAHLPTPVSSLASFGPPSPVFTRPQLAALDCSKDLYAQVWGAEESSCLYIAKKQPRSSYHSLEATTADGTDYYRELLLGTPQKPLLPCGHHRIVIRRAYEDALRILDEFEIQRQDSIYPRNLNKSIVFSGQPGTGKTCMLSYILVERLRRRQPTVLQVHLSTPDTVSNPPSQYAHLLFDDAGVRLIDESDPACQNPAIWALTDSKPVGVAAFIPSNEWLVIVTSSPRLENYKSLLKHYGATVYYMPKWTWAEVVAAAAITEPISLKNLYRAFEDYGPVPRLLLDELRPHLIPGFEQRLTAHDAKVDERVSRLLRSGLQAVGSQCFTDEDSHTLLLLIPKGDPYRISPVHTREIASGHIGRKLGLAAAKVQVERGRTLFQWLLGVAPMKSAAGWVFEGRVHTLMHRGGGFITQKLMENPGPFEDGRTVRIQTATGDFSFHNLDDLNALVRKSKGSRQVRESIYNQYIRPDRCNLASADPLLISAGAGKAGNPKEICRVVFFQITVGREHPIKAAGLEALWKSLPHDARKVPPLIVFILPTREFKENGFSRQPIIGSNKTVEAWEQYMLLIDEPRLWLDTWVQEGACIRKRRVVSDPLESMHYTGKRMRELCTEAMAPG